MGLLFDLVRQGVRARDAAEAYGLEINQHGKARCPWHDDKRPSLSFKGNICRCFACNNGGSAIDLTAQLFGISTLEAAKKLNDDFRIGADSTPGQRPVGISKAEMRRMRERAFSIVWNDLCEREQACRNFLKRCTVADINRPAYEEVLSEYSQVQDRLNYLQTNGTEAMKEWVIPSSHRLSH